MPIYCQELFAIFYSLKKFYKYLIGSHFTLQTDSSALQALKHTKLSPKLCRWQEYIYSFNFTVQHIRGSANPVSDLLSREPLPTDDLAEEITTEERPMQLLLALDANTDVAQLQRDDKFFSPIITAIQTENTTHPKYRTWKKQYQLDNHILYRVFPGYSHPRKVLCLPTSLRDAVFDELHTHTLAHPGYTRMRLLLQARYYIPHLPSWLNSRLKTCIQCGYFKRDFTPQNHHVQRLDKVTLFTH